MGTTSEQSPSTGAKVRGALPGDSWRDYVSEGAQKAYDGPLSSQREEAHKLARKGRLVAAHKREKAAYKIRVRGYDRKGKGDTPVGKAYMTRTVAAGPIKYTSKKLQLRRPTKGEERAEQLRAVLGGVGTIKLAAGAGAGALVTDAVKDAKSKSKKAHVAVKSKIKPEEKTMAKSLEERVLLGPIAPEAPRSLVEIRKDWEEISKLGIFKPLKAMASNAYREGGVSGVANMARQQYKTAITPGGMAARDHVALGAQGLGSGRARTATGVGAGVLGAGGAAWGAKKLAQRYAPVVTDPLKKRAKKYAMYGAAGAAGTVAAGTAAGNALSPRR